MDAAGLGVVNDHDEWRTTVACDGDGERDEFDNDDDDDDDEESDTTSTAPFELRCEPFCFDDFCFFAAGDAFDVDGPAAILSPFDVFRFVFFDFLPFDWD